ncbi:non-ribosomal peptide synthetase [Streptomyces canus]|uniref:non-ribosomal peptide synthetase n=1 Tax=Streptomyces canus TaxID=58343 RepID=UPI00224D685C|nr:non-ribosomal peptide synthetase [Streptomyces canus]MCX5256834.1 non-ribosomal peptide synthetase [Streptomyces canus]
MTDVLNCISVPGLLEENAYRMPDSVAVECGEQHLTYGELWHRAGSVAAAVTALPGFTPGDLVGVLLERGIPNVVAQLGIWRAGGAYLPLDPALPDGRVHRLLTDARARGVVSQLGLEFRVPAGVPVVRPVEGDEGAEAAQPVAAGLRAYVVYTSGSTGNPKGVEVGHRSLANLVRWHRDAYATGPGVRVAALAGLGFDASVWEVWATLASGATLVLPHRLLGADISAVRDFLDVARIEQCFLSTPLAELLFTLPVPAAFLRVLTTGGDRLRRHPPSDFPAAVFNHYGPTEATVVTTASGDLRALAHGSPPIGRPIAGAEVRLVDDTGAEVALGSTGELLIGGEILAIGYLHDVDLTRQKFVRAEDGSIWYRSGDFCRWGDDGQLEFVERRDTQVSLRGHRIELAEIEHVLLRVDGVDQAAVTVQQDDDGGVLAAFFCGGAAETDVRTALTRDLPRHMVPALLTKLPLLPFNTSGKIDRVALTAQQVPRNGKKHAAGAEPDSVSADFTPTMKAVAGIWEGLLSRRPGPSDDFFQIGGQSLMAARVTGRVRERFRIPIGLDVLFSFPVLVDYAREVDAMMHAKAE